MDFTAGIIARKRKETALRKNAHPIRFFENGSLDNNPTISLSSTLSIASNHGIIAECKRFFPASGELLKTNSFSELPEAFHSAGASAPMIHTDSHYGGNTSDLSLAKQSFSYPILQYDFILEHYQLYEARALGADAIVLIPDLLDYKHLESLAQLAQSLGMEVVLEINSASHLDYLNPFIDIIMVNNRSWQYPFEADITHSWQLLPILPREITKISWGGLNDPQTVVDLRHAGFHGFIIGAHFLREENPGAACKSFLQKIKNLDQLLQGSIA